MQVEEDKYVKGILSSLKLLEYKGGGEKQKEISLVIELQEIV